jgi:CHAT domain-containing protein
MAAAQALCNAALMAARNGDHNTADELNAEALRATHELPASHGKAFLLLTAGQTDRQIKLADADASKRVLLRASNSFQEALQIAEQQGDHAMATYALGYLGQMYEQDGQMDSALSLTRRAAFTAQQAQMPEALYRWEWQTGRLLNKQGEADPAIAEYRRAVQTLKPIRIDISAGYGNGIGHSSFRETVGPLFYQLADLLLTQAKSTSDVKKQQELLLEARDTMENLRTVELEDYLCEECQDALKQKTRVIEAVDKHSAVIYLIPLPDRTEMLVGLNAGWKLFTINVGAAALTAEVRDFRHNLETRTTFGYLEQSQQLYDWIVRPILGALKENQINTLVFVPDGALRTVPFAALHDGEHFLIQDLAVAVVPGLSLVEPKTLERRNVRLLLNGISEPVQGFASLGFVTNELNSINKIYTSKTLLNQQFTLGGLETNLRDDQFSIVHIASHGQFDRDVRKTFVLTYDNKLSLDDLETAIRPSQYRGRPVELLVLSACQTAAGDDRAALGLAGVAVKAGARSALASLWFVNDQSTSALITEFYEQLRTSPNLSKAQALQAAQIKLLSDRRYRHPCYWSPYLIVGNWL